MECELIFFHGDLYAAIPERIERTVPSACINLMHTFDKYCFSPTAAPSQPPLGLAAVKQILLKCAQDRGQQTLLEVQRDGRPARLWFAVVP